MNVLAVVRGRPGLGHVIPGVAIGAEFVRRGHRVWVASYGCADDFMCSVPGLSYVSLKKSSDYHDWPGLEIYDDGLRKLAPLVAAHSIDLILLGGEYLLGPLEWIAGVPIAMIFNPEIMIASDRNAAPGRLFAALFASCSYLVPMTDVPRSLPLLNEFAPLQPCFTPGGPFTIRREAGLPPNDRRAGPRVLIANGGGVAFPASLKSYASAEVDATVWLEQTCEMTRHAIRAAVEMDGTQESLIDVFSCLPTGDNERLAREFSDHRGVHISSTSMRYYEALGRADLVISRAGAGFMADCETTEASVIVWPLVGHEEQLYAAQALAGARRNTRVVRTVGDLAEAVRSSGVYLQHEMDRAPGEPALRRAGERAEALVDHLLRAQGEARLKKYNPIQTTRVFSRE